MRCDFQSLIGELHRYEEVHQLRNRGSDDFDSGRVKRVSEKIKVGELSKGLQAAMSDNPFQGDPTKLDALHPLRPVTNTDGTLLLDDIKRA